MKSKTRTATQPKAKTSTSHNIKRPLTLKQKRFVAEYIKSGNGTRSAMIAYPNQTMMAAAVQSSDNLRKPNIQEAINDALAKHEASPEYAVGILKHVADQNEEIGAKRLAAKDILELHGWRKGETPNVQITANNAFFNARGVDKRSPAVDTNPSSTL